MSQALVLGRRTASDFKTAIDWFGRFKPEIEKETKRLNVKENNVLKQLGKVFDGYYLGTSNYDFNRACENIPKLVRGIRYTSQEINDFIIQHNKLNGCLDYVFETKLGLFLSALINNCDEKELVVITQHLDFSIPHLGQKNRKNIIVKGDVGDFLGDRMKRGSIKVEGNADRCPGWFLEGGTIEIEGDAGNQIGSAMKGGRIIIKGNAGDDVGSLMFGGEISLNGEYLSLAWDMRGGDIYHKDKLLVKNGKILGGRLNLFSTQNSF
jgi:hypothetical protein